MLDTPAMNAVPADRQVQETPTPAPKTLTISLPRFDVKTALLALIAVVTALQTVQLYSLKAATKNVGVKPAAAAPAAAGTSSGSGSNSALPSMVGGC